MSNRKMVRVQHPDIETTALVPSTAVARMRAQGWAPVTTADAPSKPRRRRTTKSTAAKKVAANKPETRADSTKES